MVNIPNWKIIDKHKYVLFAHTTIKNNAIKTANSLRNLKYHKQYYARIIKIKDIYCVYVRNKQ